MQSKTLKAKQKRLKNQIIELSSEARKFQIQSNKVEQVHIMCSMKPLQKKSYVPQRGRRRGL